MPIFDHNQPKIIQVILNFPFLIRLITFLNKTDYWLMILPLAKKLIERSKMEEN